MDKLELEGVNTDDNNEEILETSESQHTQEDMIEVSCQIIEALEKKEELHNENYTNNPVSLSELKSVFLRASSDCPELKYPEKTCAQLGMAKINMFLRMKAGEKMEVIDSKVQADGSIDISECFVPSEEDFKNSDEDIKNHNININFTNAEELYLIEEKARVEDFFEL